MKATKLFVAGVAIMSAGFGLSGSVDALRSTAEVTVNGGNLILETVPNLKFEDVTVADIIAGDVVTELGSGDLTLADPNSEGLNTLTATVGDYRGTASNGWTLSAEFASFTKMLGSGLPGTDTITATMNMTPTPTSFNGAIAPSIVIGENSTLIATALAGQGLGVSHFDFAAGSANTLEILQQNDVKEGVYQAAMTWTLSATP
ncbi:hypothetical protein D920_02000 [Enterococcus faecalis 13-SD-W-01]|nr:hypothetical protein D920_02000 [Enterococcus faecalis 13-SD-W-01]